MNPTASLTRREYDITELVAWGATAKDISNMLFISPRTVTTTIHNVFKKTGVTKVNELSAWYFCKTFHISFELSPLKRTVATLAMIALVLTAEFAPDSSGFIRTARVRATRFARSTRRNNDYPIIEF
jgi:DNA-binding CsgD family transcriptional regulator